MSRGPLTAEAKIVCGAGAALKGGYMVEFGRGRSSVRSGTYWWAGVGGR